MNIMREFLSSVLASVAGYYVCKLLDHWHKGS